MTAMQSAGLAVVAVLAMLGAASLPSLFFGAPGPFTRQPRRTGGGIVTYEMCSIDDRCWRPASAYFADDRELRRGIAFLRTCPDFIRNITVIPDPAGDTDQHLIG